MIQMLSVALCTFHQCQAFRIKKDRGSLPETFAKTQFASTIQLICTSILISSVALLKNNSNNVFGSVCLHVYIIYIYIYIYISLYTIEINYKNIIGDGRKELGLFYYKVLTTCELAYMALFESRMD